MTAAQIKMLNDAAKTLGNISTLIPNAMKSFEKKLAPEDAKIFADAMKETDLNNLFGQLTAEQQDFAKNYKGKLDDFLKNAGKTK